jgi:hypothetical protein
MALAQSSRVRTNSWFSLRDSNAAMIFVHGVFSDSQSCWLHVDKSDQSKNAYWPALVAADARFGPFSIFLPDYYSAIDSSSHSFIDCAHELFSRLRVPPESGEPSVLEKKNITFICHSQGGLVVRQPLVRYHKHFESKRVGLFLIASPSRGSFYASFVERLGWLYGHQQIIDMGWDSESLRIASTKISENY